MPAAVIASEPRLSVFLYPHCPSFNCQVTQCFSTSFQYQPGISMPHSAHDQTPRTPYCELELSQGTSSAVMLRGGSPVRSPGFLLGPGGVELLRDGARGDGVAPEGRLAVAMLWLLGRISGRLWRIAEAAGELAEAIVIGVGAEDLGGDEPCGVFIQSDLVFRAVVDGEGGGAQAARISHRLPGAVE